MAAPPAGRLAPRARGQRRPSDTRRPPHLSRPTQRRLSREPDARTPLPAGRSRHEQTRRPHHLPRLPRARSTPAPPARCAGCRSRGRSRSSCGTSWSRPTGWSSSSAAPSAQAGARADRHVPGAPAPQPTRVHGPAPRRRRGGSRPPRCRWCCSRSGALCLLVAAIVFVAVTWSVLGLTGRTLVLLGFTSVLAAVAVLLTRKGPARCGRDVLARRGGHAHRRPAGRRVGRARRAGRALLARHRRHGRRRPAGAWAPGSGSGRAASPSRALYGAETVAVDRRPGALPRRNAWARREPGHRDDGRDPAARRARSCSCAGWSPLAAYGLGGLARLSWLVLLASAGTARWRSATLRRLVVRLPRLAAARRRGDRRRRRPPSRACPTGPAPSSPGWRSCPLVLLANAPETARPRPATCSPACATLVVARAGHARSPPKAWALGAAALTVARAAALGLWLMFGPWTVLSTLDPDGRTDLDSALLAQQDNAASWSAVVAAAGHRGRGGLPAAARPGRDACRPPRESVGTVAPAVLALGGLVLVLELEPPLWAGVLAAALATAVAGGAAWWSRDHARGVRRAASPRRTSPS